MRPTRKPLSNGKTTKTIEIVENLRDAINEGRYYPNETITEAQVADEYGVSITPAREALAMLSTMGYIQKVPHRGYLIRGVTLEETQMLYELRSVLESGIVALLVLRSPHEGVNRLIKETEALLQLSDDEIRKEFRRYNHEFHMELARFTENTFLVDAYSNVMNKLWRAMNVGLSVQNVRKSLETHIEMCSAVQNRDEEYARQLFLGSMGNSRIRAITGLDDNMKSPR